MAVWNRTESSVCEPSIDPPEGPSEAEVFEESYSAAGCAEREAERTRDTSTRANLYLDAARAWKCVRATCRNERLECAENASRCAGEGSKLAAALAVLHNLRLPASPELIDAVLAPLELMASVCAEYAAA